MDVAPALKESRAAISRVRRFGLPFGLSQTLILGQIALSALLVIAAALFVELVKLHSISIGFNTEKLLVFNLDAKLAGYGDRRGADFYESLRQRFANLPGVHGATMSDIPLVRAPKVLMASSFQACRRRQITRFLQTSLSLARRFLARCDTASARAPRGRTGYGGRAVNDVFARKFFPGRNVIGQHFKFEDAHPIDFQIIGVTKNTPYSSLKKEIPPVAFIPWSQAPAGWLNGGMYYETRTLGDPLALANTVPQVVHQASPLVPVADIATQLQYINSTIAPERTFADLSTGFGILGLMIACVGLYGTMAYSVARRTNEIGVRIALGAQRWAVIWMV